MNKIIYENEKLEKELKTITMLQHEESSCKYFLRAHEAEKALEKISDIVQNIFNDEDDENL